MSWRYGLSNNRYYSSSIGERYIPLYYQSPSRLDASEHTTARQLQRVLCYSMTSGRSIPGFRRSECAIHDVDCDEVYPGIYIGDAAAAKNKTFLRIMGITHVLNAAEGCRYGQVDTGHGYYRDMPNMRYMGFPMIDAPTTNISRYFYVAAKFIESAINNGGKILVHCLVGMSRSATCVLAYLMICRKMSAVDAIRTVRMRRDIHPNEGFLQQLADLDMELKHKASVYPYQTSTKPHSYINHITKH